MPAVLFRSFPSQREERNDSCRAGGFFETRLSLKRKVRVWGQGRGQACLGSARSLAKEKKTKKKIMRPTRGKASFRYLGTRQKGFEQSFTRHRGCKAEEAGGQCQAVLAVVPGPRHRACWWLNGSEGKINLGAHTQPRRRYDFISPWD